MNTSPLQGIWLAGLLSGLGNSWGLPEMAGPHPPEVTAQAATARPQNPPPAAPQTPTTTNLPQIGARLAAQGDAARGVPACVSCHGANGEGMATSGFPRLSGQPAGYLVRQIESFANGSRPHAVMTPIAKAMSPEQNRAAAIFYSQLTAAAPTPAPTANKALTARGERLALRGDEALQLQACANYHGPGGTGEANRYPALAGQHESYLTAAMQAWKTGQRRNDPSGQMPAVAASMNEADIAAVAGYYAALAPASRSRQATSPGAAGPTSPSPAGAGAGQATPPSGTGSEQTPLSGGGQGPGGGGATQLPTR